MGSIWSLSPLKPWRVPGKLIHPPGRGWILPRHDAFDLDQLFHLGSLPNSESSAPGRRLQALLRQAEAPGWHEFPRKSRKAFFLVGWNVRYVPVFFSFRSGGLCVGFIHLSVCFWFGWDKMKVQQVKIKQYVYIYIQDIDCRCWMSAFDEFCLLGLLKHWRTWKWMKLCNFWRSNLAQEGSSYWCSWSLAAEKGLKEKTSWTDWRFHTYFRHILTSLLRDVESCWDYQNT